MANGRVGIIGGSGLYNMEGLDDIREIKENTPFGDPSDSYISGILNGQELIFLARHGRGHTISPSEINSRANIYGFKKLGVDSIISISAVGSLKEELKPLDMIIPDQFFDHTNQARKQTFFEEGIVAHISFADPVCSLLSDILYKASKEIGARIHKGGTYLNMEGPAFSTRAESHIYKKWGMDIIGMTNMAEAKLAREAEICYATLAAVTDYDVWREAEGEDVTIETVIANLLQNVETAQKIIILAIKNIPKAKKRKCPCQNALATAIVTDKKIIPPKTKEKLKPIIEKYIYE
jgi:5'-methylthioadenosine phosphorylase